MALLIRAARMPYGMLLWREEGQQALVSDPKDPVFVKTPLSAPQKSLEKRTAKLRLSDDGTLEGDVRVEYTGHSAVDKSITTTMIRCRSARKI
jgi:hypothetical protein